MHVVVRFQNYINVATLKEYRQNRLAQPCIHAFVIMPGTALHSDCHKGKEDFLKFLVCINTQVNKLSQTSRQGR